MSRRPMYRSFQPDDDNDLDDDNQRLKDLFPKVENLKSVSIAIGEELRDQNRYLSRQLGTSMDNVWLSLSNNMNRVKALSRAGHNRYIFYLLGFTLFVLIIIYFMYQS